jgi:hypothetical protein
MAWADRIALMREIEQQRGTSVVCYVTSDRQGASGKIASDAIPWLYRHLQAAGKSTGVDLVLYSTGGTTMTAWRIVSLFREFAERFCVLIPYKAHSAATLIALGADEIVMLPTSELSPVDPSTQSPFNPCPQEGVPPAPIMVEDVIGYVSLARDEARLTGEDALRDVFRLLADKVHPLALGHVFRARQQIRMLARKLLSLHMPAGAARIDEIIRQVTEELLSHDYPISRKEAEEMKLPIQHAEKSGVNKPLWGLFEQYRDELSLLEPWTPELALQASDEADTDLVYAMVESERESDAFVVRKRVKRASIPQLSAPGGPPMVLEGYQEQVLSQAWRLREGGKKDATAG